MLFLIFEMRSVSKIFHELELLISTLLICPTFLSCNSLVHVYKEFAFQDFICFVSKID